MEQNVSFALVRFEGLEPRWLHAALLEGMQSSHEVLEERVMPFAYRVPRDYGLTDAQCDDLLGTGEWLFASDMDEDGEPVFWLACTDDAKFAKARLFGSF